MVTITGYSLHENKEGASFISLHLQGDLELKQSSQTGQFYATAKRCSITSTFDVVTAVSMVGRQLLGSIEKTACETYEVIDKESGEVKTMDYRYTYVPEDTTSKLRSIAMDKAA